MGGVKCVNRYQVRVDNCHYNDIMLVIHTYLVPIDRA